MISFQCGACGSKYKAKPEFAGKKTKCPKCSAVVIIQPIAEGAPAAKTTGTTQEVKRTMTQQVAAGKGTDKPQTKAVAPQTKAVAPQTKSVAPAAAAKTGKMPAVAPTAAAKTGKMPQAIGHFVSGGKGGKVGGSKALGAVQSRQVARHRDVDRSKLHEAAQLDQVEVHSDRLKESLSKHSSPLDQLKTENPKNRLKSYGAIAVFLLIIATLAFGIWYSMQPDEEADKRIQKENERLKGFDLTGSEWYVNYYNSAVPGQWIVFRDNIGTLKKMVVESAGQGSVKMTLHSLVNEKGEVQTGSEEYPFTVETTPDKALIVFLDLNRGEFKLTMTRPKEVKYTLRDKEYDALEASRWEDVYGSTVIETFVKEIPLHKVKRVKIDKGVERVEWELVNFGGPAPVINEAGADDGSSEDGAASDGADDGMGGDGGDDAAEDGTAEDGATEDGAADDAGGEDETGDGIAG